MLQKPEFKKTTLKNGIRVLSEKSALSRSAAFGVWIDVGTRHEPKALNGLSHMLEHLVFKRTKNRNAFQIASHLEKLGGELNAFTSRENTVYHASVLQNDWKQAVDILSDLVMNMNINKDDFAKEKEVISQEILIGEDNLEELAYDLFMERALVGHPLSLRILGQTETLDQVRIKNVTEFYKKNYTGKNIIISAAGAVDHDELVQFIDQKFSKVPAGKKLKAQKKPKFVPFKLVYTKPTEQTHFLCGWPTVSFSHPQRFIAMVVSTLLGGGMTSRLYQRVREQQGLVYSIYCSLNTFADFGFFSIAASCEAKNMPKVITSVRREVLKLVTKGSTAKELNDIKTQIRGSLLMGSEDIENRMQSIAINENLFHRYKPVEEVISEIEKITLTEVNAFLKKMRLDLVGSLLLGKDAELLEKALYDFDFDQ